MKYLVEDLSRKYALNLFTNPHIENVLCIAIKTQKLSNFLSQQKSVTFCSYFGSGRQMDRFGPKLVMVVAFGGLTKAH